MLWPHEMSWSLNDLGPRRREGNRHGGRGQHQRPLHGTLGQEHSAPPDVELDRVGPRFAKQGVPLGGGGGPAST
jgi:hypothetical protein